MQEVLRRADREVEPDAEGLIADGPVRFVGSYLSDLVARSPDGDAIMRAWMRTGDEARREVGYGILAARLKHDPAAISDADAEAVLAAIEREIHASPNWARYAMNAAVIAIGVFMPNLRTRAIQAAQRIGRVEVDHGETSCKTPDAASYIEKAVKRKAGC